MSGIIPSKRRGSGLTSLSGASVTMSSSSLEYTGGPLSPMANVYVSGTLLRPGEDYEMSYSDNVNVGTGTAVITGIGQYVGSVVKTFTIVRTDHDVSTATATASPIEFTYDGTPKTPSVITVSIGSTTLNYGTDFDLEFRDNVEPSSSAKVIITGKGDYYGSKTFTFTISRIDLSEYTVTLNADRFAFNGQPVYPEPTVTSSMVVFGRAQTVTLIRGTAYDVEYSGNFGVGTGTVKIVGKGTYTGSKSVSFTIGYSLEDAVIAGVPASVSQSSPSAPSLSVTDAGGTSLVVGTDYVVMFSFPSSGTCTMSVIGKGNYSGRRTFSVTAGA